MKIWSRTLFFLLCKTFSFFLIAIFLVFTLVDLSIHGVRFFSNGTFLEIAIYYVYRFASDCGFFFPLTFILASLKVGLDLNTHHELVALQMAGLSQKKLLSPFFAFATLLVFTCYAHQEWVAPKTPHSAFGKYKKTSSPHLFNVSLEDQSEIVYQEMKNNELFDVFWIKSNKDFWHIKSLKINPTIGYFADHFQRNSRVEKIESFDEISFPQIVFNQETSLIPFENRALSTLLKGSFQKNSEKKHVLCHLQYHLAIPLVSFLFLFAFGPFLIGFSKTKPLFIITALSLFAFVAFKTILDGMMILGENQVIPSFVAIWSPFMLIFAFAFPKFLRI